MQIKGINQLKEEIENILNDNKAIEVKSINLKDKTSIADFMIIASGNSSKHIQAISEILLDKLKKTGIKNCRLEGRSSSEWKLIDAVDIIITKGIISNIVDGSFKKDKDNNVIEGDPNKIKTVIDRWKFTRKISSMNPNWYLAETKTN